jgi:charged multivesicular body protein 7
MSRALLVVVGLLYFQGQALGNLFSSGPFWNGLRTTFALDGALYWVPYYDSTGYDEVPRTETEAISQGWVLASQTCDNGGMFNGWRYIQQVNATFNEIGAAALYDVNGVIAGIQMNILVSEAKADPTNTYKFDEIPMFLRNTIDGKDVYTLTAYFVDPATICTTGRVPTALQTEGTGAVLKFQNGTNPSALITAPQDRTVALSEGWSDNNCFPGMGVHNWYKQEELQATNCDYILPVFLLYTKQNQLLGFGFQHVGVSNSPRFEHPKGNVVKLIVGPSVSPCLVQKADGIGVTTMHVFLIDTPLSQTCLL